MMRKFGLAAGAGGEFVAAVSAVEQARIATQEKIKHGRSIDPMCRGSSPVSSEIQPWMPVHEPEFSHSEDEDDYEEEDELEGSYDVAAASWTAAVLRRSAPANHVT